MAWDLYLYFASWCLVLTLFIPIIWCYPTSTIDILSSVCSRSYPNPTAQQRPALDPIGDICLKVLKSTNPFCPLLFCLSRQPHSFNHQAGKRFCGHNSYRALPCTVIALWPLDVPLRSHKSLAWLEFTWLTSRGQPLWCSLDRATVAAYIDSITLWY